MRFLILNVPDTIRQSIHFKKVFAPYHPPFRTNSNQVNLLFNNNGF